ncbi:MAG: hypothetical protein PHN37_00960 [Candidatus Pacebacteria bacterium]|nr:hypothetical protein [Candidatus Paceibacterota bacterium]
MILKQYICWHFIDAPKAILKAWNNILCFSFNYFSLPLLFKTFFSYWKRFYFSYGKRFDLKKYSEAFSLNLMSRIIGAIIRFFVIIFGLIFSLVVFLICLIFLLIWILMPIWLIYLFLYGIKLI